MKRILLFLLTLTTAASAQVLPPDSTQVTPGQSFTPQWRFYGPNASDGINQFRNPSNNKWFSLYSTYQTNRLFTLKSQGDFINVTDPKYGAKGDSLDASANINTKAFTRAYQDAHAQGKRVYIPKGKYIIDSVINTLGVSDFGDGSDKTFLYAQAVAASRYKIPDSSRLAGVQFYAFWFSNTGTETYLGNIVSPIQKGSATIKIASGLNLKRGDLIQAIDTADFSHSPYRSTYKESEYFIVTKYSNDTIYVDHPSAAWYANLATTKIFKLNYPEKSHEGLNITGLPYKDMITVYMRNSANSNVTDIAAQVGGLRTVEYTAGYNLKIKQLRTIQDNPQVTGGALSSYGLSLNGVQNSQIELSLLRGNRHGITYNRGLEFNLPINRYNLITTSTITGATFEAGYDFHVGEYTRAFANEIDAFHIEGNYNSIIDNDIRPDRTKSRVVGEVKGLTGTTIAINDNRWYLQRLQPATLPFEFTVDDQVKTGGFSEFKNNKIWLDSVNLSSAIPFSIRKISGTKIYPEPIVVNIEDNKIYMSPGSNQGFQVTEANATIRKKNFDVTFFKNKFFNMSMSAVSTRRSTFRQNEVNNSFQAAIISLNDSITTIKSNKVLGYVKSPTNPTTAQNRAAIYSVGTNKTYIDGNEMTDPGFRAVNSIYTSGGDTVVIGTNYYPSSKPHSIAGTFLDAYTVTSEKVDLAGVTDATGDMWYRDANGYRARVATSAGVLKATGTNTIPAFGLVTLTTDVTGVLGSNNGGAGSVNGILKANGSGVVSAAVAGTDYVAPSGLTNYVTTNTVQSITARKTISTNEATATLTLSNAATNARALTISAGILEVGQSIHNGYASFGPDVAINSTGGSIQFSNIVGTKGLLQTFYTPVTGYNNLSYNPTTKRFGAQHLGGNFTPFVLADSANVYSNTNYFTADGQTPDAMGAVNVTRSNTGGNKAYYSMTRKGASLYAMGIATNNDWVIGTGPTRGINATIDTITFRHNSNTGATSVTKPDGTTLWSIIGGTGYMKAILPAYSSGSYLPTVYNSTTDRFETSTNIADKTLSNTFTSGSNIFTGQIRVHLGVASGTGVAGTNNTFLSNSSLAFQQSGGVSGVLGANTLTGANKAWNLPDASGTIALTSDAPTMLRLTGSGTGAATTISIPHGLSGVTSSSITIVQPINAASAGVSYITTDATNVNIVYTVAPASGTNNLSYNVSIKP